MIPKRHTLGAHLSIRRRSGSENLNLEVAAASSKDEKKASITTLLYTNRPQNVAEGY